MRRTLLASVAVLWGFAFAQAQEMKKAPVLPEGTPAAVEFHSVDAVEQHVQAFIAAVAPGTPASPILSTALAGMAKTVNPATIDTALPVRILFMKSGEGELAPVLQFFAKDPAAYLASLLPDMQKGAEKDGVTTYTQAQQAFDHAAYARATPEERKDIQHFMTKTETPVFIGQSEKAFCLGENGPAVQSALALARKGTLGNAPLLEGGDAAAQVEVSALLSSLSTAQGSAFARLKEVMQAMLAIMPAAPGRNPQQLQRMMEVYVDGLEGAASQVQRLSARLQFAAEEARLSVTLTPVQGSVLATYLASVQPGLPATFKYLPDNAFVAAGFKVGDLAPLAASVESLMAKLLVAAGVETPDIVPFTKAAVATAIAGREEMALGLCSGGGLRMVEAVSLKDAAGFQAAVQRVLQSKALGDLYQSMGMPVQLQTEKTAYNGHDITKVEFAFSPPANATPDQAAAFAQQEKMIKGMYGGAMTMDSAVLGNDYVLAFGMDSLGTLKQILDGAEKPLTESAGFKQATATLPPQTEGLIVFRVTGLLDWAVSQARAGHEAMGNMPFMIPQFKFETGPGATIFFVKAPGDSVDCDLHVPSAEIKAVVDGVKAGIGGMMAPPAVQGQPPPEAPLPMPPPAPVPPPKD